MAQDESDNATERTEPQSAKSPLVWVAGAICVLAMAVAAGFYWSSVMTVQEVRFEGHHYVSVEELRQVQVPTGVHPDSINFIEVMERFEKLPYVKRAAVNVAPDGDLTVQITEREPLALLVDGDQKIYVDQQGVRLPLILGKAADVPIMYGFSAQPMEDTLSGNRFDTIADFLMEIHKNPVSNATISEVAWSRVDGVIALTNQNGVKLIFGQGDFQERIRNWEAFYGKVVKQKGIEKMRSVDLRFEGQIVTREK